MEGMKGQEDRMSGMSGFYNLVTYISLLQIHIYPFISADCPKKCVVCYADTCVHAVEYSCLCVHAFLEWCVEWRVHEWGGVAWRVK